MIAIVHHKQAEDRKSQINLHKVLETKNSTQLADNWQNDINISDSCRSYRSKLKKFLLNSPLCGMDILVKLVSPSTGMSSSRTQLRSTRHFIELDYF